MEVEEEGEAEEETSNEDIEEKEKSQIEQLCRKLNKILTKNYLYTFLNGPPNHHNEK